MNRLSIEKRANIISCLVEGNSIRATARITGTVKNTVLKLLVDVGQACSEYQDKALRNLTCRRIQCDEIWAFVGSKEKNVKLENKGQFGYGDVYTWTALCADSKLIASWALGKRDGKTAYDFIMDLAPRLTHRIQLSTDGHKAYLDAVEWGFGVDIDYAMLIKLYGESSEQKVEKRYSPAGYEGSKKEVIKGNPDPKHISTSYVERNNLTMRMGMRRFTRLTNAFSKKVENLAHAVALHFMYYNFARIHRSLRVTPAMETGISDHVWSLEEIVLLTENNTNKGGQ